MIIASIVAGGTGSRMGQGDLPKQFLNIGVKPIIVHVIENFLACDEIDHIIIGMHADWIEHLERVLEECKIAREKIISVKGGDNRHETVLNTIKKAEELWSVDEHTIFVTHDAARPFVTKEMILENIRIAKEHGVCTTAIRATDTIFSSEDKEIISTMPDRDTMFQCQTPQTFQLGLWKDAVSKLSREDIATITDVSKVFLLARIPVRIVEGSQTNFKITYPSDLKLAEELLTNL